MTPSLPSCAGTVLIVGVRVENGTTLHAALEARRLAARYLDALEEASPALHRETTVAVIAEEPTAAALLEESLDVPVICIVDSCESEAARRLLRAGAAAVIESSGDADIVAALERVLSRKEPDAASGERTPPTPAAQGMLGNSAAIRHVLELVERVAPVLTTVLVRGETGTGKELVARALHERSPRANGPFVKVHCAALPDNLLESELFGYEKGAFTGAVARKPGRVEIAEGGTLFLDEIGDVTPAVQVKLLRLLQDREYERLGGVRTQSADVRIVTATHRDLEGMVKTGDFREDLFYRLNVVTLWLPPLRSRRDDIPLLASEFARRFANAYSKRSELDESALDVLRAERWSGNVRQLQNFVERLIVLSTTTTIGENDVRRELTAHAQFHTQLTYSGHGPHKKESAAASDEKAPEKAVSLEEAIRSAERRAIEVALRQTGGNRTIAARILGVSRTTLYAKLEEYGIA